MDGSRKYNMTGVRVAARRKVAAVSGILVVSSPMPDRRHGVNGVVSDADAN